MNIKDLLKELSINNVGTWSENNTYVIDMDDSTEFGRIYSKLEDSDLLELMENNTLLTTHNGSIQYNYDDQYLLNLISDFDNNVYKLVVSEI